MIIWLLSIPDTRSGIPDREVMIILAETVITLEVPSQLWKENCGGQEYQERDTIVEEGIRLLAGGGSAAAVQASTYIATAAAATNF